MVTRSTPAFTGSEFMAARTPELLVKMLREQMIRNDDDNHDHQLVAGKLTVLLLIDFDCSWLVAD